TALAELECRPTSIPVGEARLPVWPENFVGTISHTCSVCVAHVGRARDLFALGVDLEPDVPFPPDAAKQICHPDDSMDERDLTLNFVAKEAFYKAYFPAARTFLEFHDVHVELNHRRGLFIARLAVAAKPAVAGRRALSGRFARLAGHLVAACWVEAVS